MAFITRTVTNWGIKYHKFSRILCISSFSTQSTLRNNKDLTVTLENKYKDVLLGDIRSVCTYDDLYKIISNHNQIMNSAHIVHAFKALYDISKKHPDKMETAAINVHPSFERLCNALKKHSKVMSMNDIIEITKILSYFDVKANTSIFQCLLQIIRQNVNDIRLQQVAFLHFVINKCETNYLAESLKLALPLVFQLRLQDEIDDTNVPNLSDLLRYSIKYNIPEKYINNICTYLVLQEKKIDIRTALNIVHSLNILNITWDGNYLLFHKLLSACLKIIRVNINMSNYMEIISLLNIIKNKMLEGKECFYNTGLIDACISFVIQNKIDVHKSIQILKITTRIAHTNFELLDYISNLIISQPNIFHDSNPFFLLCYVNGLSNASYKPDKWEIIENLIMQSDLKYNTNPNLPWVKHSLELASLGIYDEQILNKTFDKVYLEDALAKDQNLISYIQLHNLYTAVMTFYPSYKGKIPPDHVLDKADKIFSMQSVDTELKKVLEIAFGGPGFIASNVQMPNNIFADFVLNFDQNNEPLAFSPEKIGKNTKYEDLGIISNDKVICIMAFHKGCYSINNYRIRGKFELIVRMFEKNNFNLIALPVDAWKEMPESERIPYLMREINTILSIKKDVVNL